MTTVHGKDRTSSPTIDLLRATAKGKLYKVIQAINDGAELAVNKVRRTKMIVLKPKATDFAYLRG